MREGVGTKIARAVQLLEVQLGSEDIHVVRMKSGGGGGGRQNPNAEGVRVGEREGRESTSPPLPSTLPGESGGAKKTESALQLRFMAGPHKKAGRKRRVRVTYAIWKGKGGRGEEGVEGVEGRGAHLFRYTIRI